MPANLPVIFIVGPTASGKTEISYLLARDLNAHIVSCDSMLIYKEPQIITAKPPPVFLSQVPHYFIDEISVKNSYNVFDYYQRALEKIFTLMAQEVPVVICGGSGLYVKALLDGVFEGVSCDESYRAMLQEKAQQHGIDYLYTELQRVDSASASIISSRDLKRIIRALEVYYVSGVTLSNKKQEAKGIYGKIPIRIFGLRLPRNILYGKIDNRVEEMFAKGAIEEVKNLLAYELSITAEKIIGINEIGGFLQGRYDQEYAKELMKRNTRHFAKRQVTWFKRDRRIEWMDINGISPEKIKDMILQSVL